MISNFNEVEKSLKRCLKEKVSITTATVVGFLIAGTVAFGAEATKEYTTESFTEAIESMLNNNPNASGLAITEDKNFNGVKYIYDGENPTISRLITVTKGTTILDEKTNISTEKKLTLLNIVGEDAENTTSVINNGKLKVVFKDSKAVVGVNAFTNNTSFTNTGTITKEEGTAIDLSAGDGKTVTFTNSGTINGNITSDTDNRQLGEFVINLKDTSKINGKFIFFGKGKRTINIDNNKDELTITNLATNETFVKAVKNSKITLNGNIQSKGTTVEFNESTLTNNAAIIGNTGISLLNGATGTNTKDGSITVSGADAIGVKVDGASTTFTNDGIITLEDGTTNGVGISVTDKGTATNNGTIVLGLGEDGKSRNIAIANVDGTAKNTGKIKITDKTSEELKDFDISTLLVGISDNTGMIVDKDGIAIKKEGDAVITENGNVDAGKINDAVANTEGSGGIVIENGVKINGSDTAIEVESLNVTGTVTIAKGDSEATVEIKETTTNLDAKGSLAIGTSAGKGGAAELKITNGTVNAEAGKTAVTFEHADSSLALSGTNFYGNIGNDASKGTLQTTGTEKATVITGDVKANKLELAGTTAITGNIETKTMNVTAGETRIDGTITGAETITIGNVQIYTLFALKSTEAPTTVEKNATVTYSADSKIIGKGASNSPATESFVNGISDDKNTTERTTVTIGDNGVVKAEVGNEGNYVFSNSQNVDVEGNGTVELLTSNLNKQTLKLKEGTDVSVGKDLRFITNSNFYLYDADSETLTYKRDNVNNKILADISNKAYTVGDVLSQDPNVREAQFDSIYSNGVYSETVKMAMDTLRMNEDAVLSLGGKPEEGKWTAQGKMLFSRTEYDRTGVIRDFGVETKTAGLLGALEYGVSEKSSVGFAFSGTKQDLDMKKASADGDAFYFGVYGKQDVNNFKLTAGLGYQLDKIDADNNVMVSTGDKYDSKAFSGYAQGKYVINAGNDVTVEPKLKLALTRLTQESAKDKHFEMEKVEATTFDTEVGVDLVKTVKLESGKMNLLAGISYTRSMGDTDNKFKGNFVGTDGTKGERFDVLGANLGENTLKINIGAEVEKDNGFFYNGGLNYKFDNEDRETFGATIGAGYKF
ncbi:autotransporter domain-containing protein [Fusobacterium ulcerans]|uniref:autotransporter family protein n=2 Tax=Fusobacterium ulcerans TaxID=861 RepID=UPI002E763F29|nr:autotransporter domain-containing protein [Fusobacterium ulcerans]MEE0138320.1 autotransporter domain-containing protein [Fusobacterium ulcerans]